MQIAIMGVAGRMGRSIAEVISDKNPDFLSGGSVVSGADEIGKTIGSLIGRENVNALITDQTQALFAKSDVVIDFTSPDALESHCQFAKNTNTALVVGTTGLLDEHMNMLRSTAESVPVVYAPNMSLGVNVLLSLVEKTASILGEEFDIEIFEAHHKHKKDAPSGTAIALGHSAAKGRDIENFTPNYNDRIGERESGDIGFSVMRGGDIVGEHSVFFAGRGERIELAHKATDRKIFARGAVHAALWVKDKTAGLYSMYDVLGL